MSEAKQVLAEINDLEDHLTLMEAKRENSVSAQRAYNELAEDLIDAEAKSSVLQDQGQDSNGIWREEIRAFLDGYTLKSLFFSESWVFITTDLVANKVSSQPLRVVKSTMQDGKEIFEPADDHPLNTIIQNPNAFQDYHSWMYNTVVELCLMGNAIIWWADRNDMLTTLPTEQVSLDFTARGQLAKYLLATSTEEMAGRSKPFLEFKPNQIVHVRKPNPSSMFWGLSPFVPGRKSVLFDRYSQDYLNAFYLRQATPGLALKLDRQVNEDVALRQLRTFELAYSGRRNQRRTLILPKGVDVETLTHTLSDQKLVELIDKNRETIVNLFKIPKHELGIQKVGSLGSEEHRLALRNFWEATLIPTMRLVEGALTKFFVKEGMLDAQHVLKFDVSNVDALQEDQVAKAELAKALLESGWTVNEVRREVYTKEAAREDDADRPFTLVRLDRNTAGLAPQAQEEPEDTEGEDQLALRPNTLDSKISQWVTLTQKQLDIELQTRTSVVQESTLDLYAQFAGAITNDIEDADEELDPSGVQKTLEALAVSLKADWVASNTRNLLETVELGYEQQLDLVQDPTVRNTLAQARDEGLAGRSEQLSNQLGRNYDRVAETIIDLSVSTIALGGALTEVADRIFKLYEPQSVQWRSERVGRTEVLGAASLGQWDAVQDAKKVIPNLKKRWVTAGDERVRESHDVLDQKTIGVDATFGNGLRFPRDPQGAASEVVNCRCSLVMIPPDGNA